MLFLRHIYHKLHLSIIYGGTGIIDIVEHGAVYGLSVYPCILAFVLDL